MINIAEILKDCPKRTKLYSPICGECELYSSDDTVINVASVRGNKYPSFNKFGQYYKDMPDSECMLFPSKENRDWNTFQIPFKDGDILTYTGNYITTFIYRNKDNEPHLTTSFYVGCNDAPTHNFLIYNKYTLIALNENCDVRLATEDEKIKLFDAIKANGYKWNAETKTLEKLIEPKFKVGDEIVRKNSISNSFIVNSVSSDYYGLALPDRTGVGVLNVSEQDDWELVLHIHKFKVGDIITNGKVTIKIGYIDGDYYYDITRNIANRLFIKFQDEWELVPDKFDISTLKPFDKVLVRDSNESRWCADMFSHYSGHDRFPFCTLGSSLSGFSQCIPYEGNEYLLGTNNDCGEYYKNW